MLDLERKAHLTKRKMGYEDGGVAVMQQSDHLAFRK